MNNLSYTEAPRAIFAGLPEPEETIAISAIFTDQNAAWAAVRELREIGIPAEDISMLSSKEDRPQDTEPSGERPAQEGMPPTEAEPVGRPMPVFIDVDVPPDEPLGGSDLLGLTRDEDEARHKEVYPNADDYVYSDFPDEPVSLNPEYPPADLPREPWVDRSGPDVAVAIRVGTGSMVGLLAGTAELTIPGTGRLIAAGPVASALSGPVSTSATGGIAGALADIGVPEEYTRDYARQVAQGQTLVSVRADELTLDPVERVLIANGGQDVA
jgi:hypothetical protein